MRTFLASSFNIVCVLVLALSLGVACKQKQNASAPPPAVPSGTEQAKPAPTNNEAAVEEGISSLPGTITPQEARNHVGKVATVRGKVYRVHVSQKGDVFIDIGGRHPNAPFTAVCFQQAIPTAQLQALDGKIISVTGKIKEYQGKVEIVLESAGQISE